MLKKLYALKNKKGFTLVELMVVVAIMGILVAIAVPVYSNVTDKAAKQTIATNCRTIDSAIMQYNTTEDQPLAAITADGQDAAKTSLGKFFQGGELPAAPKGWTVTYTYAGNNAKVEASAKKGNDNAIIINADGEKK